MQRLAALEAERTGCWASRVWLGGGNFAAGHPPLELWQQRSGGAGRRAPLTRLPGVHEYSAPIMQWGFRGVTVHPGADEGDEGWLTLRYRKAYRDSWGPWATGTSAADPECGVDGTVANRPGPADAKGWQDFQDYWIPTACGWIPRVYMDQLLCTTRALQGRVRQGAAIFAARLAGWGEL